VLIVARTRLLLVSRTAAAVRCRAALPGSVGWSTFQLP
jgi:hypothetical protein